LNMCATVHMMPHSVKLIIQLPMNAWDSISARHAKPELPLPFETVRAVFNLDGEWVDVCDLKTLLLTRGINLPDEIVQRFGGTHRLAPTSHPFCCNCLLLPGQVPVHMFHIGPEADFSLTVGELEEPWLTYRGKAITKVDFPPATSFYGQRTSKGFPFELMAVLQGLDVLSFPYLWPCQFALGGQPCDFCYQGNMTLDMRRAGQPLPPIASPEDVAEAVEYGVRCEGIRDVQLTGGSEVDSGCGEVPLSIEVLKAIDRRLGLGNIPGEIYVYTSAPRDPAAVDALFAAGVDRVAYDLNVWDQRIFAEACPGISRYVGREQQLRALEYAARRHGPNKVCSAFVVGLEPLESLLAGAKYVAERGIVPLFSVWLPHYRPVRGSTTPPSLDYYRQARNGFAELFRSYKLQPPGASGLNVCMCRDLFLQEASAGPRLGIDCIAVMKALSELSRLRIMRLLLEERLGVGTISERLGISQYNVSKHLRILKEAGLLDAQRRGKERLYGVVPSLKRHLAASKNVLELDCCTFRFDKLPM
jgi:DNA-binding transcriptional ArsR family regulator